MLLVLGRQSSMAAIGKKKDRGKNKNTKVVDKGTPNGVHVSVPSGTHARGAGNADRKRLRSARRKTE
jgi:hypothetical protein